MPVIVAAILARIVQFAITYAAAEIIGGFIADALKKIVGEIAGFYGISEDDAKILVANEIIDISARLGVGAGAIGLKLGVRATDYLGLKVARNAKRALSTGAAAKISLKNIVPGAASALRKSITKAFKTFGPTQWLVVLMVLQGVGDWFVFARPQLQKYADDLFGDGAVTLPGASTTPPGFSGPEWNAFFESLLSQNPIAIESEEKQQSIVFSKDALANLATWTYGQQLVTSKETGLKALQDAITKSITFAAPSKRDRTSNASSASSSPSSGSVSGGTSSSVAPVVFTGVVSQGTLGGSNNFVPRPDDLIIDIADLEAAMRNNLAPFLASLPSRVAYEIKVQPSYTTRDGLTIRGASQQVKTGTFADGSPKYKSVVNKFAILNLYLVSSRGTRTKIDQIVLGPTDAARFQPQQGDLTTLENAVRQTITTSYSKASSSVSSRGAENEKATKLQNKTRRAEGAGEFKLGGSDGAQKIFRNPDGSIPYVFRRKNGVHFSVDVKDGENPVEVARRDGYASFEETPVSFGAVDPARVIYNDAGAFANAQKPFVQEPATLAEYYAARNEPMQSVSDRALLYEKYDLGPANFYTGSAEQNAKLLNALLANETVA